MILRSVTKHVKEQTGLRLGLIFSLVCLLIYTLPIGMKHKNKISGLTIEECENI